jgi:hypothetical protein
MPDIRHKVSAFIQSPRLLKDMLKLAVGHLQNASRGKARFSRTTPSLLISAPLKEEVPQSTATRLRCMLTSSNHPAHAMGSKAVCSRQLLVE